jgi:hypothetical protein
MSRLDAEEFARAAAAVSEGNVSDVCGWRLCQVAGLTALVRHIRGVDSSRAELHCLYSHAYGVPVLHFNIYEYDDHLLDHHAGHRKTFFM